MGTKQKVPPPPSAIHVAVLTTVVMISYTHLGHLMLETFADYTRKQQDDSGNDTIILSFSDCKPKMVLMSVIL